MRIRDWSADVCSSDLRELRRRIAGHQRGLEKRQFLQIDVLADLRAVVGDEARQRLGLQPDPAEGMPLGKGDERIEADLLQRRGKEHRRVETGGKARFEHVSWRADLLALALEARRRLDRTSGV